MARLRFKYEDSSEYISGPISAKRAAYYLDALDFNIDKKKKNKIKKPKTKSQNQLRIKDKDTNNNILEVDII